MGRRGGRDIGRHGGGGGDDDGSNNDGRRRHSHCAWNSLVSLVGVGAKGNARSAGDANAEAAAGVLGLAVARAAGAVLDLVDTGAEVHAWAAGDADAEAAAGVFFGVAGRRGGVVGGATKAGDQARTRAAGASRARHGDTLGLEVSSCCIYIEMFGSYLRSRQDSGGANGQKKTQECRAVHVRRRHCTGMEWRVSKGMERMIYIRVRE